MDEIGLAQQQPPPPPPTPPPHDQQQPPQIDPADPPQQGDNVGRETTPGLGGRRGGYSGGGELGGGYGGFGAGGLGAYRGVEDVETDCKAHKVIVKGKQADPLKVLERVQKKSHRQVELLSPIPKPPSLKKRRKREEEKPKLKRRKKR
ncbi:hypothetical protein Sjap_023912 [Stephania japonica]|uniref:Uncharacterized protein n=1 Tax=Stephania japonica TaxID=461633 RepID=A0AAP0HPN7_9MAGN